MHILHTTIGSLGLVFSERGLRSLTFDAPIVTVPDESPLARETARQLETYLAGEPVSFDIPLDISEVGDFERRVLDALLAIPRGETRSYGDIAQAIGEPGATQAVGNAVGRNPIPIIIPCHRVIRSDGPLGGYSGPQGVKRHLLALEGITFPEQLSLEL